MDEPIKDDNENVQENDPEHQVSEHPERAEDELLPKPEEEVKVESEIPIGTKKQIKKALARKKKLERDERRKKYFTVQDRLSRLEKYEDQDKRHKLNKVYQGKGEFKGPTQKRKRTDCWWLVLFIALNGLLIFHGIKTFDDGRTQRLTRPMDFRAEICGLNRLKGLDYVYYVQPVIDVNVKQCVSSCPNETGLEFCLYNNTTPIVPTPYCYVQLQTKASGRNCMPIEPVNRQVVQSYLDSFTMQVRGVAGDLSLTLDVMGGGLIVCVGLSIIFFFMMKREKGLMFILWSSILGTIVAIGGCCLFCYLTHQQLIKDRCINGTNVDNCGGTGATAYYWAIWGFVGLGVIYILVVMRVYNRLSLGVGVVKATARLMRVLSQTTWVPPILMLVQIGVGCWTLAAAILACGVGEVTVIPATNINGGKVKTLEITNWVRGLVVFDLFMFLWWINVIFQFGNLLLSYSVATWFFTKRKETVSIPTRRFIWLIIRYHLGTVVLVSLITIVLTIPKLILGGLRKMLRKADQFSNLVRFFQASCMCCIHLYERVLRYVSKQALVQSAIWNENYNIASKKAFFLLFRNHKKIRDMDYLQGFVLFQTKLLCSLLGALFVYLLVSILKISLNESNLNQVQSSVPPTVLIFVVGFFFASLFDGQFDVANKALTQCYLMDEEMFVGEQRFIEEDTRKFMEYYRQKIAEEDGEIVDDEASKGLTAKIAAVDKLEEEEKI